MELSVQKRAKIAAILASLLIHGMIIHIVFTQWFEKSDRLSSLSPAEQAQIPPLDATNTSRPINDLPPQQPEEWAMLTAGQGLDNSNDACTLFWDEPVADNTQNILDHTLKDSANDDHEKLPVTHTSDNDHIIDNAAQDHEEPAPTNPITAQQDMHKEETMTTCAPETPLIPEVSHAAKAPTRKRVTHKSKATPSSFTLADLVKGFVKQSPYTGSIGKGGNYDVSMLASRTGTATAKQIATRHYLEKIFACIQNSFRVNKDKLPLTSFDRVPGATAIAMTLDKQGAIVSLRLVESSSNGALDRFLLFIFQDAAGMYPCIPSLLDMASCLIVYHNVLGLLQNPFSAATISSMPSY